MVKELHIRSVLDVECGEGQSVEYFKKIGCEVIGIEGSSTAIKNNVIPDRIIQHDYCDGPYIPKKYFPKLYLMISKLKLLMRS